MRPQIDAEHESLRTSSESAHSREVRCKLAGLMRRSLLIGMLLLCWLLPAAGAAATAGDDADRIVLVGDVLVDRDETAGDIVVVSGDVTIRGVVTGDVVVIDGDITIRGNVEGDVVAVSGLATLGRRGQIGGDLSLIHI